jgi:UDP-N-acetylglucosamine 1-carboxyvinyltransferase
MQSQFTSLLTTAKGASIITENIFENRFKYINELIRMGAIATIEGRTVIVEGVSKMHSAEVEIKDLRGGAALILAALMAEGQTKIKGINFVERGYENIVEKLSIIGAKIKKQ